MSDSFWPHGLQHTRLPCPSPSPGTCSNSCASSQWCHPTFSSSVIPFSSCLQSFPASGFFLMSWFFASGGQSIGASASASALPMNIQDCLPIGLTGLISLQSKGLSRILSKTRVQRLQCSAFFYGPALTSIHSYWKKHVKGSEVNQSCLHLCHSKDCNLPGSSVHWIFVGKVMSLLFNTLCRFVIAFLLRNKSLNFMASITTCSDFEDQHNKVCYCFHCFPIYLPWSDTNGCHNLSLLNVEF